MKERKKYKVGGRGLLKKKKCGKTRNSSIERKECVYHVLTHFDWIVIEDQKKTFLTFYIKGEKVKLHDA
jgi:hypothetical protein